MIEKPQYGLSWFRVRFGVLQLKACAKEARPAAGGHHAQHQGAVLPPRLDNLPEIITRPADMTERFTTTSTAGIRFINGPILDRLPKSVQLGRARISRIDLNKPPSSAAKTASITRRPGRPQRRVNLKPDKGATSSLILSKIYSLPLTGIKAGH